MADQSIETMWRELIAERNALKRKCANYKKQLKQLTLMHRLVKREWLDWSSASSRAWSKYHEALNRNGLGELSRMEIIVAMESAYVQLERLKRSQLPRTGE